MSPKCQHIPFFSLTKEYLIPRVVTSATRARPTAGRSSLWDLTSKGPRRVKTHSGAAASSELMTDWVWDQIDHIDRPKLLPSGGKPPHRVTTVSIWRSAPPPSLSPAPHWSLKLNVCSVWSVALSQSSSSSHKLRTWKIYWLVCAMFLFQ